MIWAKGLAVGPEKSVWGVFWSLGPVGEANLGHATVTKDSNGQAVPACTYCGVVSLVLRRRALFIDGASDLPCEPAQRVSI